MHYPYSVVPHVLNVENEAQKSQISKFMYRGLTEITPGYKAQMAIGVVEHTEHFSKKVHVNIAQIEDNSDVSNTPKSLDTLFPAWGLNAGVWGGPGGFMGNFDEDLISTF